jgi:hypothetical protein
MAMVEHTFANDENKYPWDIFLFFDDFFAEVIICYSSLMT